MPDYSPADPDLVLAEQAADTFTTDHDDPVWMIAKSVALRALKLKGQALAEQAAVIERLRDALGVIAAYLPGKGGADKIILTARTALQETTDGK